MPSFDLVSQVQWPEMRNALEQANREVSTRFDFKGSGARVELSDERFMIFADDEFKVGQALDILRAKLVKRGVDLVCLAVSEPEPAGGGKAKQQIAVRQGIDTLLAKRLVKLIKDQKLKVQTAIQGDQIRISGKKRDDLQIVITLMCEQKLDRPLQYINFRD